MSSSDRFSKQLTASHNGWKLIHLEEFGNHIHFNGQATVSLGAIFVTSPNFNNQFWGLNYSGRANH